MEEKQERYIRNTDNDYSVITSMATLVTCDIIDVWENNKDIPCAPTRTACIAF